jgi:hypothetical protein
MTQMREPVILEAVRTPFARAGGAFREVHPDALLAHTLDGLLERARTWTPSPPRAMGARARRPVRARTRRSCPPPVSTPMVTRWSSRRTRAFATT